MGTPLLPTNALDRPKLFSISVSSPSFKVQRKNCNMHSSLVPLFLLVSCASDPSQHRSPTSPSAGGDVPHPVLQVNPYTPFKTMSKGPFPY